MPDIENIKNRILQVIIRNLGLNIGRDELQSAIRLDDLFGMDSIAIIELVVGIEKEFGIKVPPENLTGAIFQNVNTIAEHVHILMYGRENRRE